MATILNINIDLDDSEDERHEIRLMRLQVRLLAEQLEVLKHIEARLGGQQVKAQIPSAGTIMVTK